PPDLALQPPTSVVITHIRLHEDRPQLITQRDIQHDIEGILSLLRCDLAEDTPLVLLVLLREHLHDRLALPVREPQPHHPRFIRTRSGLEALTRRRIGEGTHTLLDRLSDDLVPSR